MDIILPLNVQLYTYKVPDVLVSSIQIGSRVVVQLGVRKMYTGIVYALHNNKPETPIIKEIDSILDENPIVTKKQLQLWDWISNYYVCTRGEVMKAAMPSGLKLESESQLSVNPDFDCTTLSENDRILFVAIETAQKISMSELAKTVGKKSVTAQVHHLINIDAVTTGEALIDEYKPKLKSFIVLTKSPDDTTFIDESFKKLARAAKQQEAFLAILNEYVQHKDDPSFLLAKHDVSETFNSQILNELEKKEIIRLEEKVVSRFDIIDSHLRQPMQLSEKQRIAYNQIKDCFKEKNACLLHGVTSSGKTELYIHLIKEMIETGKQVLYLLPEIALTSQMINRLRSVFGKQVGIYHSKFSDNERVEIWNNLLKNDENSYKVILGVRSSIFLPFNNLGLIIVDEEHETSFKQYDPAPRYNARDVSYILAQNFQAKVLLGTATPSFESYYLVLIKKIGVVELKERHTKAPLPVISLIDLRRERRQLRMHDEIFSKTLLEKIEAHLKEKQQIILFQNRRGFSPYSECPECGYVSECANCDVSLTYHKSTNTLKCHHCGYTIRFSKMCPACQTGEMKLMGFGTEKVEDTLQSVFPNAKIARMDLDTTRGKNAYTNLIDKFEKKEIDILVGTQMITKGLDFENVGMVGILSADSLLRMPDFRSFERAYQLMVQVAGRAGRSEKQGEVYIQTYQPEHPILEFVKNNDYFSLLNTQMQERKNFFYPPFTRLIRLTVKHKDVKITTEAAKLLACKIKQIPNIVVLGPEFPAIPRIQLLFAQDILIKIPRNLNIATIRSEIKKHILVLNEHDAYKSVSVVVNVDPY